MNGRTRGSAGLRVLLRGPCPPPYGGVASLIVSLLSGLKERGAEDVVVLTYGAEESVRSVDGATVYSFVVKSQAWRLLLPWNWFLVFATVATLRRSRFRLKELLFEATKAVLANHVAARHRCNVVAFFQSDLALELLACKKQWGRSRGIALEVFGEIYDSPESIKSRAELFRSLLAAPCTVLSSSAHCAVSFELIDVDRKIEVVYVGVDLKRFEDDGTVRRRYRSELEVSDDAVVLLFLGRFTPQMGLDSLVALIPSLVERAPRVKFVLAGAKGELTPAALECQQRYPDRVTVMNDVAVALLPSLYAASDIVLAPSRDQHACMGVTIKEAMAAARPVIGSKSGGIPEAIVHGQTGLIVALADDGGIDPIGFEAAILSLIENEHLRAEMGRNARRRAAQMFSEETTADRTMDAFIRCLPRE